MRLIDADALRKRIKAKNASNAMMRAMKADFLAEIDAAPTIEPERKTGKWEKVGTETGALNITYSIVKCSKCGWEHSLVIPRNYCPNCGTDMRGEQE